MATKFKDFTFNLGKYNKMEEYTDAPVFVLAVRNILLSKPGNYPLTPSLGMDIEQYMFELADEETASRIKSELDKQISMYIDEAENVNVNVEVLEDENIDTHGQTNLRYILGISVSASVNGDNISTNFLLYQDSNVLNVYNETY